MFRELLEFFSLHVCMVMVHFASHFLHSSNHHNGKLSHSHVCADPLLSQEGASPGIAVPRNQDSSLLSQHFFDLFLGVSQEQAIPVAWKSSCPNELCMAQKTDRSRSCLQGAAKMTYIPHLELLQKCLIGLNIMLHALDMRDRLFMIYIFYCHQKSRNKLQAVNTMSLSGTWLYGAMKSCQQISITHLPSFDASAQIVMLLSQGGEVCLSLRK